MSTSPPFSLRQDSEIEPRPPGEHRPASELRLLDASETGRTDAELWSLVMRAERLGRSAFLCEAAVGAELPEYVERCRWRQRTPERDAGAVLLFTDAARLGYVWSWVEVPGTHWVEYRLPKRIRALEASFRRVEVVAGDGASALDGGAADEVAQLVERRCRAPGQVEVRLEALLRFIAASEEVVPLRRLWKAARGIRILDRDCTSPEWIAQRASALELIYLALLERMRVWVDDLDQAAKRRPEHLRDFKEVVQAAEAERWGADRTQWVRWQILRRNVFAIHKDDAAQERFSAWARTWVGAVAAEHLQLVVNSCVFSGRSVAHPTAAPGDISLEGDVLRRSLRAARDAFGTAEWTYKELAEAAAQIEHRRALLLGCLDPAGSPAPGDLPLELCFPILQAVDKMDLVRRP